MLFTNTHFSLILTQSETGLFYPTLPHRQPNPHLPLVNDPCSTDNQLNSSSSLIYPPGQPQACLYQPYPIHLPFSWERNPGPFSTLSGLSPDISSPRDIRSKLQGAKNIRRKKQLWNQMIKLIMVI